jgi:hypothetical protein
MAMGAIAGCTGDQTGTILIQMVDPTQNEVHEGTCDWRCSPMTVANLNYTNSQTASTSFFMVLSMFAGFCHRFGFLSMTHFIICSLKNAFRRIELSQIIHYKSLGLINC